MKYELNADEPVKDGIRRVVFEELESAYQLLSDPKSDRQEAVHESRKSFKKIRAALRLIRDGLDRDVYRRENKRFRNAGRKLAEVRDAAVRIQTLERLLKTFQDELAENVFSGIQEEIAKKSREIEQKAMEDDSAAEDVLNRIREAQSSAADWRIKNKDSSLLYKGLSRVHSRGRKALGRALKNPSPENLHEFRRQAKYLWYHLRLLRDAWPAVMDAWIGATHRLEDCLGENHDLDILRQFVGESLADGIGETETMTLFGLIGQQRERLRDEGLAIGRRVYREKSSRFAERVVSYWMYNAEEVEHES